MVLTASLTCNFPPQTLTPDIAPKASMFDQPDLSQDSLRSLTFQEPGRRIRALKRGPNPDMYMYVYMGHLDRARFRIFPLSRHNLSMRHHHQHRETEESHSLCID